MTFMCLEIKSGTTEAWRGLRGGGGDPIPTALCSSHFCKPN